MIMHPEWFEPFLLLNNVSKFDRLTGVKHLRNRGKKAVRFVVVMKAIGLVKKQM